MSESSIPPPRGLEQHQDVRIRERQLPKVGEVRLLAFQLERDLGSLDESAQASCSRRTPAASSPPVPASTPLPQRTPGPSWRVGPCTSAQLRRQVVAHPGRVEVAAIEELSKVSGELVAEDVAGRLQRLPVVGREEREASPITSWILRPGVGTGCDRSLGTHCHDGGCPWGEP